MFLASSKSYNLLFIALIAIALSISLRNIRLQKEIPFDVDVEHLLMSGRAKERWSAEWQDIEWATKGTKRALKPRLPRYDQKMRDLVWGDVQFLHTTDIHGYYLPHHSPLPPSTSYSADWADWVSFIERMRDKADSEGRDLVVVDTGDLITGHGLSDARNDVSAGLFSNQIFALADYDILTIGNHELYSSDGMRALQRDFVPRWQGRYLTSNVNITTSAYNNVTSSTSLGSLYASYLLPQTGLRLTALGILFDFRSPLAEITVQSPKEMLRAQWFVDLMQSTLAKDTDIWLLAGHMPLDGPEDEWDDLVSGMRQWDSVGEKPIVGLGGHTHLRNCRQDPRTILLQSGRFHETAGFVSLTLPQQSGSGTTSLPQSHPLPTFSRRYIDLNPINLAHHLSINTHNISSLTTPFGHYVRHLLHSLSAKWNLDEVYGFAPQDWFLDRYPGGDQMSILHGTQKVLRRIFWKTGNATGAHQEGRVVVINSGSLRSDIRKGPFTKSDQFIVSPFSDSFYSIHSVPYELAVELFSRLNQDGIVVPHVENVIVNQGGANDAHIDLHATRVQVEDGTDSLGYVTTDSCGVDGRDGDDTVHSPISIEPFEPPYIVALASAPLPTVSTWTVDRKVEIVTVRYLLPRLLSLLDEMVCDFNTAKGISAGRSRNSTSSWNVTIYDQGKIKTRDLWMMEAQQQWGGSEGWEEKWQRYCLEAEQMGFETYDV